MNNYINIKLRFIYFRNFYSTRKILLCILSDYILTYAAKIIYII